MYICTSFVPNADSIPQITPAVECHGDTAPVKTPLLRRIRVFIIVEPASSSFNQSRNEPHMKGKYHLIAIDVSPLGRQSDLLDRLVRCTIASFRHGG
jgi:hypothetical protein